jgi:hypothetical protein
MSDNNKLKVDLTSGLGERILDVAKEFLEKLIMPTVEETGLLISEQISRFRFNNQLKTLVKAREKCINNGINPKTIPFKLLCPLLEGASFEDDNEMQDVWASLLANLVDSEQNIQNHIFPYLLSQISKQEWVAIRESYLFFIKDKNDLAESKKDTKEQYGETEKLINERLIEFNKNFKDELATDENEVKRRQEAIQELNSLRGQLYRLRVYDLNTPFINDGLISELYQYSNLYRLGITKQKIDYMTSMNSSEFRGKVKSSKSYHNDDEYEDQYVEINIGDLDISIDEVNESYYLSDLGMAFVKACLIDR